MNIDNGKILDIAEKMLGKYRTLDYGLQKYLESAEYYCNQMGGSIVSTQVIASMIATYDLFERLKDIDVND